MTWRLSTKARIEFLAEPGDALGQEHVVDAELQIRVLAPDVQLPVRVLRESRDPERGSG